MLLQRLRPFSTVAMSLTASLCSGCNTIGERRIMEKCKEQVIGKIKLIGGYTVWKFTSYATFVLKAEYCRTSTFGEHSLPDLLRSHKQRNAPLQYMCSFLSALTQLLLNREIRFTPAGLVLGNRPHECYNGCLPFASRSLAGERFGGGEETSVS